MATDNEYRIKQLDEITDISNIGSYLLELDDDSPTEDKDWGKSITLDTLKRFTLADVLNTKLTGFLPTPPESITDADSIFTGLQKLQALQNVNQATFASIGNKNQANGYAGISSDGKILSSVVPRAAGDYAKAQITGLADSDSPTFSSITTTGSGQNVFGPKATAIGTAITYQNTTRLSAYAARNNATVKDIETVLLLGREGVPGAVFANFVRHDLSRYEGAGNAPRTRYDIRLSHGDLSGEGNNTPLIQSLFSGGWITQKLMSSTMTDALLDDGYYYLFSNGGTPTIRYRSGGTYTNIALSGSGGGGLTSFNGRTAANAVPTAGDYTKSMITGLADTDDVIFKNVDARGRVQARLKGGDSGTATFMDSSAASLYAANSTMTSDTVLASPETILTLGRKGRNNIAYDSYARFDLSRYELSPAPDFGSRTRLDIRCSHGVSNDTPILMSLFSGGWITQKLPTSTLTDALLEDGYCYLFNNGGVPTLRSRTGATYTNTALGGGGGGSIPYLQQNLLALGSSLSTAQKNFFTSTEISSATVQYEPSAPANGKFYSWRHFKNGQYGLTSHSDNLLDHNVLLAVVPDATDTYKSFLVLNGPKVWSPHILNFGGSQPFILDSLLTNGTHSIIGWSNGASGAKAYDWHLNTSGELALKRINDAGNAYTETVMSFQRFDANTTNVGLNGKLTAAAINSLGVVTGYTLLVEGSGTNAYLGIRNTSAAAGLKQAALNANTDGSVDISVYSDLFNSQAMGIRIERTAASGIPTVSAVRRAGGGASFDIPSDKNFKENIENVAESESIDVIMATPVDYFNYTDKFSKKSGYAKGRRIGTLAQDMKKCCPAAVKEGEDGLSISIDPIFWHLVNSVKALSKEIEHLKTLH